MKARSYRSLDRRQAPRYLIDDADHLNMQSGTIPCWMALGPSHAAGTDSGTELA